MDISTHSKNYIPKVSIGMPVYNGEKYIRKALDSLLEQTFTDFEILISDNGSVDGTEAICREYVAKDSRIRYVRQAENRGATANFQLVLDEARGEYFMWAAHDDMRSRSYVSMLLSAMQNDPYTILSFGDLYVTYSIESEGYHMPYSFDNTNLGPFQRMRKAVHMPCAHIYGLWRTEILRSIRFHRCVWWSDLPIMTAAAYLGKFKYVPGPKFSCLVIQKSDRAFYQEGRASLNKFGNMRELHYATYKTCAAIGGIPIGIVATLFVAEKHICELSGSIFRKLKKALAAPPAGSGGGANS